MNPEFFNSNDQYQIFRKGNLWADAFYLGFDGECHVFANAYGVNSKYYISNLDNYAFASDF